MNTDAPTGNEKVYGIGGDNQIDLNGDMVNPDIILYVLAR